MQSGGGYLCRKRHMISIVGAGGKTTLLYTLAEESSRRGWNTLVSTTTHIRKPDESWMAHSESELRSLWEQGRFAVVGRDAPGGKLTAPEQLERYAALADVVLLEADGAKCMACKVPRDGEPVLLPECELVIGVMGLDVLGQPLREACFRWELAAQLLGVSGEHRLTEDDLAAILLSERGTRKLVGDREYWVVLNKCDDASRLRSGRRIRELLRGAGVETVFLTRYAKPI
ncbi:MAG: selenium cofactor biosynthesis protein YqeC [Butyricicoccus sp.]